MERAPSLEGSRKIERSEANKPEWKIFKEEVAPEVARTLIEEIEGFEAMGPEEQVRELDIIFERLEEKGNETRHTAARISMRREEIYRSSITDEVARLGKRIQNRNIARQVSERRDQPEMGNGSESQDMDETQAA